MSTLEDVREWLEKGTDEAKDISEISWDVDEINDTKIKGLVAVNPKLPVKLYITDNEEFSTIRIIVPTGILTADLPPEDKLKTYRALLVLNKTPLAKIYLEGINGEVFVVSDLSTKTLGEDEFHDSISFTISTVISLYNRFGVPKDIRTEMLENLVWLIQRRLQKGWTREKLEEFLVNKVGMGKPEAEHLLETIFPTKKKEEKKTGVSEQMYM
ncbi:MAG: hypothetical protein F7B59_02685 [Desulfurococcales archaeon]|nr:hypothetical protein [Desulfurococcales archaeon]